MPKKLPPTQFCTVTEYCAHRKISKPVISQHLTKGRLDGTWHKNERGEYRIDWRLADDILDQRRNARILAEQRKIDKDFARYPDVDEPTPVYSEDAEDSPIEAETLAKIAAKSGATGVQAYMDSQNEQAHYRAKLAKLKFEQLEGTMILAAKVEEHNYEMARTIRDNLLELPDRLSSEFAAQRDERKIAIRLDAEIRRVLEKVITIIEEKENEPSL